MSDNKKGTTRVQDLEGTEQKGLVQDVIVPIVQSGVSGYVGAKVAQGTGKKPDKE